MLDFIVLLLKWIIVIVTIVVGVDVAVVIVIIIVVVSIAIATIVAITIHLLIYMPSSSISETLFAASYTKHDSPRGRDFAFATINSVSDTYHHLEYGTFHKE